MKKLIIIVVPLLLLLGGGGAAAYYFLLTEEHKEAVAEAIQIRPDPGEMSFDPFVVPIIQQGKVTHHLTLYLTLNLEDEKDERDAKKRKSVLMDRILYELYGLYGMRLVREMGFDNALVRERLLAACKKVLMRDEILVTGLELEILEKKRPTGA